MWIAIGSMSSARGDGALGDLAKSSSEQERICLRNRVETRFRLAGAHATTCSSGTCGFIERGNAARMQQTLFSFLSLSQLQQARSGAPTLL
jgi:hypothetical protein